MPDPLIAVHGLEQRYGDTLACALGEWTLAEGEQHALAGASGSGKSTFLHLLGGLLSPTRGQLRVCGVDLAQASESARDTLRATSISYVFQTLNLVSASTVLTNVLLGAPLSRDPLATRRRDALAWLERMGVAQLAGRLPAQCSQGQQQRVAVARACMKRPRLLLADEPTAHLDPGNAATVITLLQAVATETGAALVLASHDPAVLARFDRVTHLPVATATEVQP